MVLGAPGWDCTGNGGFGRCPSLSPHPAAPKTSLVTGGSLGWGTHHQGTPNPWIQPKKIPNQGAKTPNSPHEQRQLLLQILLGVAGSCSASTTPSLLCFHSFLFYCSKTNFSFIAARPGKHPSPWEDSYCYYYCHYYYYY